MPLRLRSSRGRRTEYLRAKVEALPFTTSGVARMTPPRRSRASCCQQVSPTLVSDSAARPRGRRSPRRQLQRLGGAGARPGPPAHQPLTAGAQRAAWSRCSKSRQGTGDLRGASFAVKSREEKATAGCRARPTADVPAPNLPGSCGRRSPLGPGRATRPGLVGLTRTSR